ncbi:MAG: DUF559 domain-containing protein [bacterium]|nr:DUF559 domain-containing protein [bacterium]
MARPNFQKEIALVGVLKSRRDLKILLDNLWYRIPLEKVPKQKFSHLIFYQPAEFGRQGQRISYYGKIANSKAYPREKLLPDEKKNHKAKDTYLKIKLQFVKKLRKPIKNFPPRRISFALIPLANLFTSKNILELYNVPPTEEILRLALEKEGIKPVWQHYVLGKNKRYRLDFAIPCKQGKVAIECDNKKAHSNKPQKKRDQAKDKYLRQRGWQVVRLKEDEIIFNMRSCLEKIHKAIKKCKLIAD